MVFANLTQSDKEAFFALLDEYFESRGSKHGMAALSAATGPAGSNAMEKLSAASTTFKSNLNQHLNRKEEGSAGTDTASSGEQGPVKQSFHQLRDAFANIQGSTNKSPPAGPVRSMSPVSMNKMPAPPIARRVVDAVKDATATTAPHPTPPRFNAPAPPPTAPRRTPSTATTDSRSSGGSTPSGLQASKKIGNFDVETPISARIGNAITSFGSKSSSPKTTTGYSPPQALPTVKHSFAPPPTRRMPSTAPPAPPVAKREPTPEPEPEPEGEWAEALYDYRSDDKGDLQFSATERVLVIERTSDDWWTGQLDGKTGLFPASYVKVL
ncbi:hypothetical protein FRC02_008370 [Tulasnella sp. 418]|nr:hypothetical protein FRC02_008370 [Tulasnella sp. 418]